MSREQARKILREDFSFAEERGRDDGQTIEQVYRGRFASYRVDEFVVDFHDKKLVGVAATLPSKDDRTASKRWMDLVVATVRDHGEASSRADVPSMSGLDATIAHERLDRMIAREEWIPKATWDFSNGAHVYITVNVGDPNRFGTRELVVVWIAVAPRAFDGEDSKRSKL